MSGAVVLILRNEPAKPTHPIGSRATISLVARVNDPFTLRKIECSKQANALNNLAWNNNKGLRFYFVGVRD